MVQNRFLAKSGGSRPGIPSKEETIMEHTEKLLAEYERLGTLYPFLKKAKKKWEMLKAVCLFHDFGKLNRKFQERIKNQGRVRLQGEIHHAILSTAFLNLERLQEAFGDEFTEEIFKAILFHHHRKDLLETDLSLIEQTVEEMEEDYNVFLREVKDRREEFPRLYEALSLYADGFEEGDEDVFLIFEDFYYDTYKNDMTRKKGNGNEEREKKAEVYIFLKGLLNRIDYAASAGIYVEHENTFLENGLEIFMKELNEERRVKGKEETDWNPLQLYMRENQEENLIVVAQTGMGKTEAALWWIGNQKGFFTLPLRTAINSIYERIRTKIIKQEELDTRLGLLHSDSLEYYSDLEEKGNLEKIDLQDYYTKTKQASLPLTIATLDQIFLFVFRHIGFEEKLATLAYSKVVVDEVQMYGADLTAYLILGLSFIQKMGGKFAILTATFPSFIKDLIRENGISFKEPIQKFAERDQLRHALMRRHEAIHADFIWEEYRKAPGKRILVICNTVKKCQTLYCKLAERMGVSLQELKEKEIKDRILNMLHASFIKKDRKKLEEGIFAFTEENSSAHGIWITTSIAEASLDIDFDLLITELSDINSLFQRLGRCFRRRIWIEEGYNCVVFDGGEGFCSGVGKKAPINEEIFLMSKEALIMKFPENVVVRLGEEMKMVMVEEIYSTKNIKEKASGYYDMITDILQSVSRLDLHEMSKAAAIEKFRNIRSKTMIPLPVYEENKEEINGLYLKLGLKETGYEEKIKIRQRIRDYTVDIRMETYERLLRTGAVRETLKIPYEIHLIDYHYDSLTGAKEKEDNKGEGIFL